MLLLVVPGLVAMEKNAGLQVGYGQGPGFMLSTTVSEFAQGFPWDVRFGFVYSSLDPGDPRAARRTFINDGNNGTPQEDGSSWDLRLDILFETDLFPKSNTYLFAGPRYSRFTGSFKYVGGNEQFDVTSRQWGVGAGIEGRYPFLELKKTDLVVSAILDYYLEDSLSGHDTVYSPSGSNVNPRRSYNYGDADAAINQPKLVPRVMVGINYALGDQPASP
jgi:hypothetical protein